VILETNTPQRATKAFVMSPSYDHVLPNAIVKRRGVRKEFARREWLCRTRKETFLLDRHVATKDYIEPTNHATAKAAQLEGVTISMVRYPLYSKISIYKRKIASS
jgi:hypothetical protein